MDRQTTQTQAYALDYWDAGLVAIPAKLDGSKSPSLDGWKKYQTQLPERDQVASWFSQSAGIAVLMGSVSGAAECIDFDDPECCWPILNTLDQGLLMRLAIYETPKGGWHVIYRCSEIFSSVKLARRKDKSTRIETRGENSYIVTEGSPLEVHKAGLPYIHYCGRRLESLGEITPAERKMLWRRCAQYDQTGEPTQAQKLGRMQAEQNYRELYPPERRSVEQASKYLATMEPAIQGADGSSKCFRVACKLVGYFGLDRQDALHLMMTEYNPRCSPPWSQREIEHKLDGALRKTGGVQA